MMKKLSVLGVSSRALIVGLAGFATVPAFAQDATDTAVIDGAVDCEDANLNKVCDDEETTSASGNEIIVTGSRIARPGLDTSVPVTSVTANELLGTRGDVSLGDALNELPALRSTFSQANSTGSIGTAGLNFLDLRGLGTNRTLTLLNGRRIVTASPGTFRPDINTIPSDLLERVDVVTGGNSAIYGSDAVAGVVNFILKRDYEGLKLRAQGGVTTYGDRGSYSLSGIYGKNFGANDQFNVAVAGEYARSNALFFSDRDYLGAFSGPPGFITSQITTAPNRNFDGIPNTVFVDGNPGIKFGNISLGGYVLTTCPAATSTNAARVAAVCTGQTNPTGGRLAYNFAFNPAGQLVRDDPSQGLVDNRAIGGGILGGLSSTGIEDAMLLPGLERYNGTILLNANISPAFHPFAEFQYTHVNAEQQSTQPTFVASTLSPVFSTSNPFLSDATKATLATITGNAATFTMQRFNNDLGTRSEDHKRDTYRAVVGVNGMLSEKFNLRYEVAGSYGRTENYYEAGGNVNVKKFNQATNAVRNSSGTIVCAINNDSITTNDDPSCVPLNLFGFGTPSQAAKDYVLFRSSRSQWAEQIDVTAFISGDLGGFFELPGGPIGFALGGEYRREDAYSAFDEFTRGVGNTFLNGGDPFDPPALTVKEAFGEVRIPLLGDMPFFNELTLEASGRVSDYSTSTGTVYAYNSGIIYSPFKSLRFRATYARAVRAPNLLDLFATPSQTFANGLTDPCDQPGGGNASNNIVANPNRAKNCAALGIPTTLTYKDSSGNTVTVPYSNVPGSGVSGFNQGNSGLEPEVSNSFTVGGVFQPTFIPGLALTVDYYNIRIKNVISGLTGQTIINLCVDDPGGIDNQYCKAVFRRSGTGDPLQDFTFAGQTSRRLNNINDVVLPNIGPGFLNQPFNFAGLTTRGIDADLSYTRRLGEGVRMNLRAVLSYVMDRKSFGFVSTPDRFDRIDSTLGDPKWAASFKAAFDLGDWDVSYNARYIGKQIVSGLSYETFFSSQGRPPLNPDARPFVFYDPVIYHNLRVGLSPSDKFRFYLGVDNVSNELPPFDLTGVGSDAIYPNTGRFFYSGVELKF